MNILLVLIPVTLLVILIAVAVFFWAVNHQQFDDLDSPGFLPLLDEPATAEAAPEPDATTDVTSSPSVAVPLQPRPDAGIERQRSQPPEE